MTASVLDASAVVAYLGEEPGSDALEAWLDRGAGVSALNVQEAMSRLVRQGVGPDDAGRAIAGLGLTVYDLTLALALEAGAMILVTRPKGLSHGDRACLALAKSLGVPALTGDRAWAKIAGDLDVRVELFR